MRITKNEVKKVIKEMKNAAEQNARYGNGEPCTFRRIIKEDAEFTLVEDGHLYVGSIGATVSRIKEGRREDNLCIDGKVTEWASLIANSVVDEKDLFFTFDKPFNV